MTKSTTPTHIPWIDILRIAACFLVVLAHSCDFFVAQFETLPSDFLAGALWGSLVRPCVPIFVMITGVLLLPVSEPMGVFYKKRMSRVLIPLIFWGIVTPLLYVAYGNIEWPRAIEFQLYHHSAVVFVYVDRAVSVYAYHFALGGGGL